MSKGCKLKWNGREVVDAIDQVALETAWLMGQDAITQSINDVPLDTGTLRRSGVVTVDYPPPAAQVYSEAKNGKGKYSESARDKAPAPAAADKRNPKVVASYNTPYAIRLHETRWRPRNWKYSSWKRSKRSLEDVISRTVKLDEKGKALYLEKIPKPAVGRNKWLDRVLPII